MKKPTILLPLLLMAVLAGCGGEAPAEVTVATTVATQPPTEATTLPTETTLPETEPQPESFTLTFVGDCTLGSTPANYGADMGFVKVVGQDYDYPFRNVLRYFENDDGTFANLEGPLTDTGYPVDKKHVFQGATDYVNILLRGSIEAVSLANNHTLDYGKTGYASTLATLQAAGMPYVERDATALIDLPCGLKVGLYGAVYYYIDRQDMVTQIQALRDQGAEVVIVAPHWGAEGSYRVSRDQEEIGHAAIDAGADIVWGSHPHVLQPMEEYNGGLILYSMGNFCFGGNCAPKDLDSAIIQQQILRDPDGTITLGERTIIPCSVGSLENTNNFQPTPYPEASEGYQRVMEKLTGTYSKASYW